MDDATPELSADVCEVCGQPAEMQITEIDRAGQVSVRNICLDHLLPAEALERMPEKFRAKHQQWIENVRARRDRGD